MKAKFQEKCMPTNYYDKLYEAAIKLKQNGMTVVEYMQKFDELQTWSQILEDPRHTLARYKYSLRYDIRRKLLQQPIYGLEQVFWVSLDLEEYFESLKKPDAALDHSTKSAIQAAYKVQSIYLKYYWFQKKGQQMFQVWTAWSYGI